MYTKFDLESMNLEVRTGYKVNTNNKLISKNSIRFVVCSKTVPSFIYVCTTLEGNLIFYENEDSNVLMYSDSRFYGWGSSEEQAISNVLK